MSGQMGQLRQVRNAFDVIPRGDSGFVLPKESGALDSFDIVRTGAQINTSNRQNEKLANYTELVGLTC